MIRKIKVELYSSYEQLLDVEENELAEQVKGLLEILEQKFEKREEE